MGDIFRKNDKNGEVPEDFVLFKGGASDEVPEDDGSGDLQETRKIDLTEISAGLEDDEGYDDEYEYDYDDEHEHDDEYDHYDAYGHDNPNVFMRFIHNNRVVSITAGILIVALVLFASAYGVVSYLNPLRGYAQVVSSKENVLRTMDVESTLQSGNRHNITSLVAGKIVLAACKVGDTVKAGDVLYKIDDTDAKLAVERAQNELAKSSDPAIGSVDGSARIIATEAGVLKTLTIRQGSSVSAGSQIGTVLKSDGTVAPLISYVSGKVTLVSVNQGRTISIGQVIASLSTDEGAQSDVDKKYSKKSGEIDVQSAQRHLENYTIKAPFSGVVAEMNNKVGDNIGITNSDNPMLVIVDTSTLSFTFSVDEYRVREMEKGMEVILTTESLANETFTGEISYVSAEGKADENGKPMYEVGVTVNEPGNLKAGMNIKAKVVLASAKKVVAVPEKALLMSDGQNALVLVKNDQFADDVDKLAEESRENEIAFPEIKVPKGCSLISVRYGISDGLITQIISGVKVGDIIVYDEEADNAFVVATGDNVKKAEASAEQEASKEEKAGANYSTKDEESSAARTEAENNAKEKIKNVLGKGVEDDVESMYSTEETDSGL